MMESILRYSRCSLIAALALIAGCATGPSEPPANSAPPASDRTVNLQHIVDHIEIVRAASRNVDSADIPSLRNDLPQLEAIVMSGPGDATAAAAHYYAGRVADLLNHYNAQRGAEIDPTLAQKALTQYGATIAFGRNIPEWKITIPNVEYTAGTSAYLSKSFEMATTYWRLCAKGGHAGCMNALANDLIRATMVTNRDLDDAVALFKAAADSGIQYRCAGLYSDDTLAYLIHFGLIKGHPGEDIEWLGKARDLWRQLHQRDQSKDPCNGASIGIDEFMMRSDAGDRQTTLLDWVVQNASSSIDRSIAEYLLGNLDEAALQAKLSLGEASGRERCGAHFLAFWYDLHQGRHAEAEKHYAAMAKLGDDNCDPNFLYVRKLQSSGYQ